jgi:hypothetical protein
MKNQFVPHGSQEEEQKKSKKKKEINKKTKPSRDAEPIRLYRCRGSQ